MKQQEIQQIINLLGEIEIKGKNAHAMSQVLVWLAQLKHSEKDDNANRDL